MSTKIIGVAFNATLLHQSMCAVDHGQGVICKISSGFSGEVLRSVDARLDSLLVALSDFELQ